MQLLAALLAVLAAGTPATAVRMHARPDAVTRGTSVRQAALFTTRVFANASVGFALADVGDAQYPVRSVDRGRTWRIDGPQVHVDAADGPEGVGHVGVAGPRTFFAYGSSVVDVTTDGGRTWWETFLGELVVAVVSGRTTSCSPTSSSKSTRKAAVSPRPRGSTYRAMVAATGCTAPR